MVAKMKYLVEVHRKMDLGIMLMKNLEFMFEGGDCALHDWNNFIHVVKEIQLDWEDSTRSDQKYTCISIKN